VNDKVFTPLHLASPNGHREAVKLRLENGAHPNDVNESKDTPLQLASEYRRPGVARVLLDSGADAIFVNDNMMTLQIGECQSC
jgi:ankyrin repeat protein